eukprot:1076181_1
MAHFALTLAAYVLYIQFLWQIHSQYTTIFYLNMDTSTGWSVYPHYSAVWGDNFNGCDAGSSLWATCCRIRADGADAYIYRSLLTSSYGSLQLQFDITSYGVRTDDACTVYYAYDSLSGKTVLQSYDPPTNNAFRWVNQVFNLPNSASANTLWIWFEVTLNSVGGGYDYCFVDNVYLKATYTPTHSLTKYPTSYPTPKPTPKPTSNPTMIPTKQPSRSPTMNPTKRPTQSPTLSPSNIPTHTPFRAPTMRPTDPSLLSCGQQAIGDYNDQTLEFYVRLSYAGDLTFDASSSNIVIQSLSAVFGSTPVGSDTDHDGILTLYDAMPSDYSFALRAPIGDYGAFDVRISCQSDQPTPSPSKYPVVAPTIRPTTAPTTQP